MPCKLFSYYCIGIGLLLSPVPRHSEKFSLWAIFWIIIYMSMFFMPIVAYEPVAYITWKHVIMHIVLAE